MSEHHLPAVRAALTPEQIAQKMATGHSVFSPSGAEMTTTCAESLVINALADDDTNLDSATGTVAHWLGEKWLRDKQRPSSWIGRSRTVKGFKIPIDDEMMEFVHDYVKKCRALAKTSEESFTERSVDISDLTPIPEQGGTMDFGGMGPGWLKVIDLKYGKEPVLCFDPVTGKFNKQLCIYAWGVFLEFDWLYNFQTITIGISQPRLVPGYDEVTLTRAELIAVADEVRAKWAYNWANPKGRTPSIKGCRWCADRAKCPALYLFMAEETNVFRNHSNDDEDIEEAEFTEVISEERLAGANALVLQQFEPSPFPAMPVPAELSLKAMEKILRYRKLIENYFNAIQQEVLTRAISDEEELTWWKIVQGRSNRKWVDDEEWLVEQLIKKSGLERKQLFKTVMLSPAEMERLLHTEAGMKLVEAKKLLADKGLAVQPPGQKTLAPKSDRRKALPKDGDVFRDHS